MKKTSTNVSLLFVVVLTVLVATTLLESLPCSSASTPSPQTPPKTRTGLFGRRKTLETESSDNDTDEEDTEMEDTNSKRKSSWQFFYHKTETDDPEETTNEAEETTTSDDDDSNSDDEKPRFRFGMRRRRKAEPDDSKTDEDTAKETDSTKDGKETTDDEEPSNAENKEEEDNESSSSATDPSESKESDGTDAEEKKTEGESKDEESKETTPAPDPMQQYMEQYQAAQRMQQQRMLSPGAVIYRSSPSPYHHQGMQPRGDGSMPSLTPNQAMAAAALVNLLALTSRIFFVKWLIDRLAFESESKSPIQHFMWECLNDKFVKDDEIWNRVLGRAPLSMGVSQRKWDKTVRAMGPVQDKRKPKRMNPRKTKDDATKEAIIDTAGSKDNTTETTPETSRTVVVMDFSTMQNSNPDFLRFADIVTFLVGSNSPKKQMFGQKPEVVLLLQSPGGEVTSFAFAAAQVARLRNAGWNVTVCVDRIAASGGYMIASQATQILASPFAMVGSVGVITESLNFYEILKKHGIQSLVLKAGDNKNPITQFGKVSDEDIKTTQKDLDETHQSFIDLCRSRRPTLDPSVCNGKVLSGTMALQKGMIDRILTSDEYILEKIADGDLVMKLHLVSGNSERFMIANALQILPHLSDRVREFLVSSNGGPMAKLRSLLGRVQMDGNLASKVFQIVGLISMVRNAVVRSGAFAEDPSSFVGSDTANFY